MKSISRSALVAALVSLLLNLSGVQPVGAVTPTSQPAYVGWEVASCGEDGFYIEVSAGAYLNVETPPIVDDEDNMFVELVSKFPEGNSGCWMPADAVVLGDGGWSFYDADTEEIDGPSYRPIGEDVVNKGSACFQYPSNDSEQVGYLGEGAWTTLLDGLNEPGWQMVVGNTDDGSHPHCYIYSENIGALPDWAEPESGWQEPEEASTSEATPVVDEWAPKEDENQDKIAEAIVVSVSTSESATTSEVPIVVSLPHTGSGPSAICVAPPVP